MPLFGTNIKTSSRVAEKAVDFYGLSTADDENGDKINDCDESDSICYS